MIHASSRKGLSSAALQTQWTGARTTHCGQTKFVRRMEMRQKPVIDDDELDDDTVYYMDSEMQANIDELAALLASHSKSEFDGL